MFPTKSGRLYLSQTSAMCHRSSRATSFRPRSQLPLRRGSLFGQPFANVAFGGAVSVKLCASRQRRDVNRNPSRLLQDQHDLDQRLRSGGGGKFSGHRHRENAMRASIAAVLSVAVLMSLTSGAFAQGAQPSPNPTPSPTPNASPTPGPGPAPTSRSTPTPTSTETPPLHETGRYHPCPGYVSFGNGRSVCLGVYEPRRHVRHVHVARWSRCWGWGWPLYSNSYSNWAY